MDIIAWLVSQPVPIPLVVGAAIYSSVVGIVLLLQSAYDELPNSRLREWRRTLRSVVVGAVSVRLYHHRTLPSRRGSQRQAVRPPRVGSPGPDFPPVGLDSGDPRHIC